MFASRDRPRTLVVNLVERLLGQVLADIRTLGLRRERDCGHRVLVRRDKLTLALVPSREQFRGGRSADEARVRDAGEAHSGNVTRRRIDAVEVPDSLARLAVELARCGSKLNRTSRGRGMKEATKETAAVVEFEDASVAPGHFLERLDYTPSM